MANPSTLTGLAVIAVQNANQVPIPFAGREYIFRDAIDLLLYTKNSNGTITPVGGGGGGGSDIKTFELDFSFDDFQPDGTVEKVIDSSEIPVGYAPLYTTITCTQKASGGTIDGVRIKVETKSTNAVDFALLSIVEQGNAFGGNYIPELNEWRTQSGLFNRMVSLSSPLTLEAILTVKTGVINDLISGAWRVEVVCVKRNATPDIIFP